MKTSKQKTVPFFNYPYLFVFQEEELISIIRDVGRRGAFIMQKDLADFEANLAAYTGAKFAVGVARYRWIADGAHGWGYQIEIGLNV